MLGRKMSLLLALLCCLSLPCLPSCEAKGGMKKLVKRSTTPTEFWDLESLENRLGDTHLDYEAENEDEAFHYGMEQDDDNFYDAHGDSNAHDWHHNILNQSHEDGSESSAATLILDEEEEEDSLQHDEPFGSTTNPKKPLDLVMKAVTSGQKDETVPSKLYEEGDLYSSAVKWLTRAEGSVLRDADLLAYIKGYYDVKEESAGNGFDQGRAKYKGNKWQALIHKAGRNTIRFEGPLKQLVMTTGKRYKQEADTLLDELQRQEQMRASQETLDGIDAHRQRMLALKNSWEKVGDPLKAMAFAKVELRMFKEAWESEVNNGSGERNYVVAHLMRLHAANAIAWNMKARLLAQDRLSELVSVREERRKEKQRRRQRPQ